MKLEKILNAFFIEFIEEIKTYLPYVVAIKGNIDDCADWCANNIQEERPYNEDNCLWDNFAVDSNCTYFFFKNEKDAIHFKLVWA